MLPWCFQSAFEGNAVQSVSRTIVFEQCIPRAGFRITFPSCTAAGTNNSKCPVSQWCRLIDSHTHTVPVQTHTVYPWVHYTHWNNRRIHSVWSIGQNMHTQGLDALIIHSVWSWVLAAVKRHGHLMTYMIHDRELCFIMFVSQFEWK